MTMARTRASSVVGKGWDSVATPVPGDVAACMQEMGLTILRQTGHELVAKCPMHFERTGFEDKHPSWSVNEDTGIFNCFSCGYSGQFVFLVMDVLDLERADAVAWIRKRGGIERVRKVFGRGGDKVFAKDLVDSGDTTKQVNEASLALFVDPPRAECEKRGFSQRDARHFGVLWDRDEDLWIIPIRDPETGELWGWQEKNERYFRNRPNSVKKSRTLFGLDVFERGTAILVESPLDVVRLHSAGISGGLASYGVKASEEQFRLVRSVATDLIVALDNDNDGVKMSQRLRLTYGRRIVMRFLSYNHVPDVKDIGDMSDEEIRIAIKNSVSSVVYR